MATNSCTNWDTLSRRPPRKLDTISLYLQAFLTAYWLLDLTVSLIAALFGAATVWSIVIPIIGLTIAGFCLVWDARDAERNLIKSSSEYKFSAWLLGKLRTFRAKFKRK